MRLASAQYHPDLVVFNNTTRVDKDGRTVPGLGPGSSDLICCYRGRFVAIELKRDAKEKPRPDQELFMQLIRRTGGFACVVWSEAGFHEAMQRVKEGKSE